MTRIGIFMYGVLTYLVMLVVFVYSMGFVGGFFTPTSLDAAPTRPIGEALAIDIGLLAVFAIQHSGMARPAFKRWWIRMIPESAERSTYVLISTVLMIVLFAFWQPIGGVIWSVTEGPGFIALTGLYAFGWALLLYTTFLIDHFDLFGLSQVWRQLFNKTYTPPQFHTPALYKVVRHPLYIGWFTIFWAAPTMTVAHLVFAVITTVYILVAIRFEERDLTEAFGDKYIEYKRRTGMLVPRLSAPDPAPAQTQKRAART